jgi:hypothetical protein
MKYRSKDALIEDIVRARDDLGGLLDRISVDHRSDPGVWGDGWTVKDLVAHLAEWHALFLGWYREGLQGRKPEMPAPGFKWNQTPALNRAIQEKHRDRPYQEVWADFSNTHAEVLEIAVGLSERDLLDPGRFPWTGRNALVTYLGANTSSHYRFASKVLKRWLRRGSGPARKPGTA